MQGRRPGPRGDDARQHGTCARLDGFFFAHQHHVGYRERTHPVGIAAGGWAVGGRRVFQIAVVARDVATQQLARFRRHLRIAGAQASLVECALEEGVGLGVRHRLERHHDRAVRPERLRALAVDGDDLVGQQADIVLCIGIGHAEAEAGVVVGTDVRNAEAGAADFSRDAGVRGRGPATVGACAAGQRRKCGHGKRAAQCASLHESLHRALSPDVGVVMGGCVCAQPPSHRQSGASDSKEVFPPELGSISPRELPHTPILGHAENRPADLSRRGLFHTGNGCRHAWRGQCAGFHAGRQARQCRQDADVRLATHRAGPGALAGCGTNARLPL